MKNMKKKKINKKKIIRFSIRLFFIFCLITSILCLLQHANILEQKNGKIVEQNIIQQSQETEQEQNIIESTVENIVIEESKQEEIVENPPVVEEVKTEVKTEVKVEKNKESTKNVTSRGGYTAQKREETVTTNNNGEWIKFTATGYCACVKCCGKTNGITASGTKATAGRTIAMPKGYAFGTKIEIQGKGIYTVEDRGGAIQGNKLDIYFNTHQEALNWGRRTVYIRVVK